MGKQPTKNSEWIGLCEAASRLGVSRQTVLGMVYSGKLTVKHLPGSWTRVRADEIAAIKGDFTKLGTVVNGKAVPPRPAARPQARKAARQ
jgi:excisionase family DNA binding protein